MQRNAGFTLLEMIVVVSIIAVLASVGGAPVLEWNCKRGLQRDFGDILGVYEDVRSLALSQNRSMMLVGSALDSGGYQFQWGDSNRTCSATPSAWMGSTSFPKAAFSSLGSPVCYHANQTATGTGFTLSKSCGGKLYQYRSTIYGATGFTLTERKFGDGAWEEL